MIRFRLRSVVDNNRAMDCLSLAHGKLRVIAVSLDRVINKSTIIKQVLTSFGRGVVHGQNTQRLVVVQLGGVPVVRNGHCDTETFLCIALKESSIT